MYAIAFDMDTESMKAEYPNPSWQNGYDDIRRVLANHGFSPQQGSVYFGDPETVTAVSTVVAVQDVAKQLPWFSTAVRDIRMLRIEDNNDLSIAL
jgi:virulence-associated protein VapD